MPARARAQRIATMRTEAGTGIALAELDCGHELWTRGHWLAHCEGYSVESSRGRVGYVEDVLLIAGGESPVALRIRTRHHDLVLLSIEHVREISPSLERIVVEEAWSGRLGLRPDPRSEPRGE
jgi:hypothetical protein